MKKFITIGLSLLVCSSLALAGTTGKIAGVVVDAGSEEPLIGANIVIDTRWSGGEAVTLEYPTGASTNAAGEYFVLNLGPGFYDVKASFMGYTNQVKTQVRVEVDKTIRVNFQLQSTTITGEEVIVTAFREKAVEPDLTATKQSYFIEEIEEAAAGITNLEDVLNLQADVVDNHFRGGREGETLYMIGGADVVNPLEQTKAFNPMVTAFEQVEVYTSGFSAEYGNAQSGVVNMIPKEGGERWLTTIDGSSTLPYYRTWVGNEGGNYYSPEMQDFYNKFLDEDEWLKENPQDPNVSNLWQWEPFIGWSAGTSDPDLWTRQDSLYVARLRLAEYLNGFYRMGMETKNRLDTRFDITTGGPLSRKVRLFLAARQEIDHYGIPIQGPNKNRQLMSNLVYRFNVNDRVKLSYIYNNSTGNNLNQASTAGHIGLQAEWIFRQLYQTNITQNYGLQWSHIFSPSTFMDLNFNILDTQWRQRTAYMEPGHYSEKRGGNGWYHPLPFTGTGWMWDTKSNQRGEENTLSYNFRGDFTSQMNTNNLIKGGLQFKIYDVDVYREFTFTVSTARQILDFNVQPYEGALYLQDKLEFEGMIANIGLRWDFYHFNTDYFADIYAPLRNPEYDPTLPYPERDPYYDQGKALKTETEFFSRLQPRFGVAFPISEHSVVHANYGTFTQRPSFNRVFYNRINTADQIVELGNPALKPENTIAYDVGLVQGLPMGVRFEASAYYKDVKDLLESAFYTDSQGNLYRTFRNLDYAAIKGFHLSLEKTAGMLSGIVRYNFESATGKSSSPFDAPVNFIEATSEEEENEIVYPDPEDIYLSYDRSHKLVTHLTFRTSPKAGFEIAGFKPFANLLFSMTYRFMSGRPYTWDEEGLGLRMNKRTPNENDMRIRLQKHFRFGNYQLTAYMDGFNILNSKVFNYGRVFGDQTNVAKWEEASKSDWTGPDREEYVMFEDEHAPYVRRYDFHFVTNEPRHFRLGLRFRF